MRVAIIGAGPAGISASLILTSKNVQVTILDEQHTIGGQNYRNSEIVSKEKVKSLGFDYVQRKSMFKSVEKAIQQKLLILNLGASVWSLTENKEVSWSINGKSFQIAPPFSATQRRAEPRSTAFSTDLVFG